MGLLAMPDPGCRDEEEVWMTAVDTRPELVPLRTDFELAPLPMPRS